MGLKVYNQFITGGTTLYPQSLRKTERTIYDFRNMCQWGKKTAHVTKYMHLNAYV